MRTRSFVLEGTDGKRFWDITWDGPEVEITTGKWGSSGRARSATFDSPSARDVFVAAEIAKATKKGFRESAAVAPQPDAPSAARARKVASILERAPFDANFGDVGAGHVLRERGGAIAFFWSCH